jgi:hypothetical protein
VNSDKAGHATKDQSGSRAKGARPQWGEKKARGEVGRLDQNRLEKEECHRVDIKNRNPFIFQHIFFKKIVNYFEFKSNLKFE